MLDSLGGISDTPRCILMNIFLHAWCIVYAMTFVSPNRHSLSYHVIKATTRLDSTRVEIVWKTLVDEDERNVRRLLYQRQLCGRNVVRVRVPRAIRSYRRKLNLAQTRYKAFRCSLCCLPVLLPLIRTHSSDYSSRLDSCNILRPREPYLEKFQQ